jgi:signal peptidase II
MTFFRRWSKTFRFGGTALAVALLDACTKQVARQSLLPEHTPREMIGDVFRLTLVYNPGAAFGLSAGRYSRWVFTALATAAMIVIWRVYRETSVSERSRLLALGLVMGGALGNLVNRLWSNRGVVDFLDVGIGSYRWPTFNFADVGVSIGACLLAWVLWRADKPRAVS